ncbi:hypothetical protein [Pseudodesulfovibrio piezophilus]|uniref:Uncharacterized protein n=1 Tax=Pseudodesulfovibrio piezophilus (strain DSM 21447 / JCM 15486 / C1TLV30) TaxID=1322246 RepID=M1WJX2_PSEP2|nr:hypothetical protein [Pseudodesulfovibrio piezophilus]CCH48631.1 conserved protein of unknown function [Pseudodesulfovibrio piezophilus C1TLV30]
MTTPAASTAPQLDTEQRLTAYQKKLRALKERSSLREVMERELLLEFITVNQSRINEYPLLKAQQKSVLELLCGRIGHPGYEYIHQHIANFIILLAHHGKAVKAKDTPQAEELQAGIVNTEAMLIKCIQGIVFAMALITDNFEEIVLRYFGQHALREYSDLIEKYELDDQFWKAFVEQFVASRVEEAHKEILEGEKYDISKERHFLVIRFLFDDILAKLNPTDQTIEKTRIQKSYVTSRTEFDGRKRAKFIQSILIKGLSSLSQAKEISNNEYLQAARITCVDTIAEEFETQYQHRVLQNRARKNSPDTPDERDPEAIKAENLEFKFLMDQIVAMGVGAAIAIGRTSDHFYKALEGFVPEQIDGIRPLAKDFGIPTLERILYFLLENHTIHILQEMGRSEGSKIQVRSGRARRVGEAVVDALPAMTKIRKKQLFGNDVTRKGTLLFKPKTAKQMAGAMTMLSLEPDLQKALTELWQKAIFRVDIMVLLNLEQIARTTTNITVKLAEILEKYGVSKKTSPKTDEDEIEEVEEIQTSVTRIEKTPEKQEPVPSEILPQDEELTDAQEQSPKTE